MNFLKRHWLLWLLLACLLCYQALQHLPSPRHGPYQACDDCALQTPPADASTSALIRREMPRAYALPWVGALLGARFIVCNPSYCADYRMTLDGNFINETPPVQRVALPACGGAPSSAP